MEIAYAIAKRNKKQTNGRACVQESAAQVNPAAAVIAELWPRSSLLRALPPDPISVTGGASESAGAACVDNR